MRRARADRVLTDCCPRIPIMVALHGTSNGECTLGGFRGLAILGVAALVATAALLMQGTAEAEDLVIDPASPSGMSWPCSSFSDEKKTVGGIDWSYRICGSGGSFSELDFRFRNEGSRPVVIGFRAWLERPGSCDHQPEAESGRAALAAGETSPWADHLFRVRTEDFGGRVWLCAHEIEEFT
jgi:hypothetical protein